jgi:hypothetical protein
MPGGRPKGIEALLDELMGDKGRAGWELLWRVAQGHSMPIPGTVEEDGRIALDRVPSLELQTATLRYLLERRCGKTPDRLEIGPAADPIDLRKLAANELRAYLALTEKASRDDLSE